MRRIPTGGILPAGRELTASKRSKDSRWVVLVAMVLCAGALSISRPAYANDGYVGIGLGLTPGQPKFSSSGDLPIGFAFELRPQDWRFSFSEASFDSDNKPTAHLNTQVFGAEKLFVQPLDNRFSLVEGLGVGFYQVVLSGSASGSGSAFGLMASAGGRFHFNQQLFGDLQFQYRNAAIAINSNSVVDAGWTGFALDIGYVF
jgi:hypothetical protein